MAATETVASKRAVYILLEFCLVQKVFSVFHSSWILPTKGYLLRGNLTLQDVNEQKEYSIIPREPFCWQLFVPFEHLVLKLRLSEILYSFLLF